MRKIGLYLRVSTEEQARLQEGSLISQRHRLEEYVRSRNIIEREWGTIVKLYVDEAKSGKDTKRPQYQELLRDVENRLVDTILVTELSRLSRSIRDFCALWDFLKAHNAQFLSLREQFDTTTAAGEMIMFSIMNFAQFERKQTAERVAANFFARAKRGLYNGGQPPLGLDPDPKNRGHLVVNDREAVQVRRIFDIFLEQGTLTGAAEQLEREGIRTKRRIQNDGKIDGERDWNIHSLWHLLRNRIYVGDREINKRYRDCRGSPPRKENEYQVVRGVWTAIISEETFEMVQKQLVHNRKYKRGGAGIYEYIYSSVVRCAECGGEWIGKSGRSRAGDKHYYYSHRGKSGRCRLNSISAPNLHLLLRNPLRKLDRDGDLIAQLYQDARLDETGSLPDKEERWRGIDSELRAVNKTIFNLVENLKQLPEGYDGAAILTALKANETRKTLLQQEVEKLKAEIEFCKTHKVDEQDLFRFVGGIGRRMKYLTPHERKRFVRLWFKNIEISPVEVRVTYFSRHLPRERGTPLWSRSQQ